MRTIPKQVLTKRRRYFGSIRKQLKHTLFVRGELICFTCQSKENLELHHIVPLAMGGNNSIDNLMVLCHTDHVKIHTNNSDMNDTGMKRKDGSKIYVGDVINIADLESFKECKGKI